ncbi:DUF2865 domain-containing protein [Hyphomicrobium sp.]|uniref:DUF2865 domain-containing protein n=1 Tax=Hyphomicrobium sp. TaxID=82 RepID=UPI000F9C5930|nr:DUF2865 domain-containing protein [Hyphomicrobium sp.]RUP08419.1 MAG: DUF2865 domain-containing protein [Hyphomicrobium sp.]
MLIFPFVRRGILILAILCAVNCSAPAQTVAHRPVVDPFRGQTTVPVDALELDKAAPYTTMCVRSCDGFYFPLHQNERPQNFQRDAQACASACGPEATLFYFPSFAGNPGTMINLAGQRYADEPHAFEFKRAMVRGCACKPAPWSREAAARHQKYSIEAAQRSRLEAARAGKARGAISAATIRNYFASEARSQKAVR